LPEIKLTPPSRKNGTRHNREHITLIPRMIRMILLMRELLSMGYLSGSGAYG
jgi:hypothetical protein